MKANTKTNSALVKQEGSDPKAAYEFSGNQQLIDTTKALVGDTVKEFKPTWWTEDWANLHTTNNGSFSFRFDRDTYLATLIVSPKGSFLHHGESKAASLVQGLVRKIPDLTINTGSSGDVSDAMTQLIGKKRISDVTVSLGTETEPDAVRILFTDGSFAMSVFKTGSLIAVEHRDQDDSKKVYAVQGRDSSHKRIDLLASAAEGKDMIYRQAQKDPVFEITLPSLNKAITE